MAQADAEGGDAGVDQLARRPDRIVAGFRVAGAVGQEDAVRLERQYLLGRGLRRHHRDAAAAAGQHAQDVALDAEVVGHHVPAGLGLFAVAAVQRPLGLRPGVGLVHRHFPRQIQPAHAGGGGSTGHRLGHLVLADGSARLEGDDAPVLGTLAAQHARQAAGVDAGDGHQALVTQVVGQVTRGAEVGRAQRQVLDHQSGSMRLRGLDILVVDPVATNVRIGQRHDLSAIAGICQDLLVTGQCGVEDHFADGVAGRTHGMANEVRAVCKCEQRGGQDGKQRTAPGFAGSARPAAGPQGHRDSATSIGGCAELLDQQDCRPELYPLARSGPTPRRSRGNSKPERNTGELECAARVYPAVLNLPDGD